MFQRGCVLCLLVAGCSSLPAPALKRETARTAEPPRWSWAAALPCTLPRAEIIPPTVTDEALAAVAGEQVLTPIRLASIGTRPSAYRVIQVAGRPVRNCQEFYSGLARAKARPAASVVMEDAGAPSGQPLTVELDPARLAMLEQVIAPGNKGLTVAEGGNTWVLLREDGVCLKLHARVERSRGMLQVVLSSSVALGKETLLPEDVRAWSDGKPLRCLTAAEALELLYQPHKAKERLSRVADGVDNASFAVISERPDYRTPFNLSRMQEEITDLPFVPALASIPGTRYPGSPLVGDARALAAFLQQRELCRPGAAEQTGWILFAGEQLKQGRLLQIDIAHAGSSNRVSLELPPP